MRAGWRRSCESRGRFGSSAWGEGLVLQIEFWRPSIDLDLVLIKRVVFLSLAISPADTRPSRSS